MVARLTPDQKVACSIHVGFNPLNLNGFFFFSFFVALALLLGFFFFSFFVALLLVAVLYWM